MKITVSFSRNYLAPAIPAKNLTPDQDDSGSHYAMTLSLIVKFMWKYFGLTKILSYTLLTKQLDIRLRVWRPR